MEGQCKGAGGGATLQLSSKFNTETFKLMLVSPTLYNAQGSHHEAKHGHGAGTAAAAILKHATPPLCTLWKCQRHNQQQVTCIFLVVFTAIFPPGTLRHACRAASQRPPAHCPGTPAAAANLPPPMHPCFCLKSHSLTVHFSIERAHLHIHLPT